jgi:uncharacterized protein
MKERVFKRKIYRQLLDWKNQDNGSTALLIEGARRVGKSTIVEEFARNEYETYLLIDFSVASKTVRDAFLDISNLDMLFTTLQINCGVHLTPGKSLIIFDEIQKCPLARQAIKHLVKDGRFHYIETGSLLGIKMKKRPRTDGTKILIPSEERRITMYPMDYEEFRWALGDTATMPLAKSLFGQWTPPGDATNRKLMRDFRLYVLVGGMPQAVNAYLDTLDLSRVDQVKRNIINLYDSDFYELDPSGKTSMLFHAIPAQLNANASRYQVGSVIEGGRADRLTTPLSILRESMTTNIARHSNDPSAGLAMHINPDCFKLYCGDTGLFVTLAFWDSDFTSNDIYRKLLSDKLSADLGYVYENVVAQMLVAAGKRLYYHTWRGADGKRLYEVDFLTTAGGKLNVIEVKSAQSKLHASLDNFMQKYPSRVQQAYIVHSKDLRKDGAAKCVPFYMVPFL